MRRQEVGGAGEGRPDTVRLRLVLAWLLGALLVGPLGSATPGVAAPQVAPNPVHVATASTGGGQAAGRLTHPGAQAGSPNGRAALVRTVEVLWVAQGAPQGPGTPGVPVAGPSLDGLVPVALPTRTPARVAPASAPAALRGRAPPAPARPPSPASFPLPA